VRHLQDDSAVVGVGGQQPPSHERVQFDADWLGQFAAVDPPSGRTALLVDRHQPKQPADHLVGSAAAGGAGVGQGGIGLADQRTLHSAQLLIACRRQPPAASDAVDELLQGERQ
jgi:hypothetical protein